MGEEDGMPVVIQDMKPPGTGAGGRAEGQPGPIRPRGALLHRPFLLLIALAIALFIAYDSFTESEPYRVAEAFVRQDAEIRNALGEVRTCRLWFPFRVDFSGDAPRLHLTLRIEGAKADMWVFLTLRQDRETWRVAVASYEDGRGMIRPLIKAEKSSRSRAGKEPAAPRPAGTKGSP
jgi:hypothetical protein